MAGMDWTYVLSVLTLVLSVAAMRILLFAM
jgi:hypothetical protein